MAAKSSHGSSKKPDGHTEAALTDGCKQLKADFAPGNVATNIGPAPASRVYTRDYSKIAPELGDVDLVGPALGNPFRW